MAPNLPRSSFLLAVASIVLLGAGLRVPLLANDVRLQSDEALYATYGRGVALHADLLLTGAINLDKPPLLFYALGGSFALFGVTEFAARLPNLAASLISLATLAALGNRLYGRRAALLAALLLAVSPFDRAFATTAFTDPLMTLFILLACLAAVRRCWSWVGVWLFLAFATKPSALQAIPLVILLGAIACGTWRAAWRAALPFLAGVGLLILWSAARGIQPDFWTLNNVNNNPGRFIRANEIAPRLSLWLAYLSAAAPFAVLGWLAAPLHFGQRRSAVITKQRAFIFDLVITACTLAATTAYWLVAFNTYDRYLHWLAPFFMLLLARVLLRLADRFVPRFGLLAALIVTCFITLLVPVEAVGSNREMNRGIDQLAAAISVLPPGSTVYDHWLGWELRFYLGDAPPIALIWEPSVGALLSTSAGRTTYLVAPWQAARAWFDVLEQEHVRVDTLSASGDFVLVRLSRQAPPWESRCLVGPGRLCVTFPGSALDLAN